LFSALRYKMFGIILLSYALNGGAEEFVLEGIVVDQTISRVGHLFYDALVANWEVPNDIGVITVRERPNAFTGNIIAVDVNNTVVFQNRMGTRAVGIEEKAISVRQIIIEYNQQQHNSLQTTF
jgi:curli production assembly/transport component CsgE